MLKSKKIIAVLAIVFLLITICVQVQATEDNPLELPLLSNATTANEIAANSIYANAEAANAIAANSVVANSIYANQVAANSVMQPTINPSNTTVGGNNLPQTGVTEDITVMFFIIVCVVSAGYAYKKIRDYNL